MTDVLKIIEDCNKGKTYAQDWIFNRYARGMLGVCMRYCHNKTEAEDVLQEGFIKVYQNMKCFIPQNEGSLTSWIKRIMVNTAINHYRDTQKHRYHEDITEINEIEIDFPDETNTDTDDYEAPSQEVIMDIIQKLPEGYKMVFNLYVFEHYSHKEIAEALQISENTSKTQLMKARILIKKKLVAFYQTKNQYAKQA